MRHDVLVIGGGSIGERHVRCFQRSGRAQVALCEPNDAVRERVASTYELENCWSDLEDAVVTPPQIAVICTPAHLHVEQALRLAECGCHLLIEKPLSISTAGLAELQQRVRERQLTAAVAYVYRVHPGLEALRAVLHGGRFGKPVQVVAQSGQHFPLYRPAYREIYYRDHATGGGAIQDALTHLVNAVEWLVGPATRVCADAAHQVLDGVSVEDTVHALTRHGPILGSFSLNQHQPPNESSLTVVAERGALRFEMHRHRWMWCDEPGAEWTVEDAFELERDDLFVAQANRFLDVVEGHGEPPCSLQSAAQTLQVNLALLASVRQQTWITIDAV